MCSFKDEITQESLNIIMFLCVSVEGKGSREKKERRRRARKRNKTHHKVCWNFAKTLLSRLPLRSSGSSKVSLNLCNLIQFSRWFWSGVKLEWVSDWAIWDQTSKLLGIGRRIESKEWFQFKISFKITALEKHRSLIFSFFHLHFQLVSFESSRRSVAQIRCCGLFSVLTKWF